ncbi:MAG TPA: diguanylate cyclase, partial [Ureibacillus sp.]|nr:diguanylate cyclase [Ureibacillus sp.]
MAYGTRFGMSTAVCYLRIQFPIELLHNEDQKLENQLQKLIVSRLKQCVREIDTIGVVNSTDFIILLTDVSKTECTDILERLISHIKGDYTIKQRTVTIKIAIGTSIFPYDGRTTEQLIMLAQAQMYEVIALGSNS